MAIQTVKYLTSCLLPCYASFPAEVVLCITSSKIAPTLCPDDVAEETYARRTIEATLTLSSKEKSSCNQCLYSYTFTYDDEQLLDGEVLYAADISGVFCKDCFTKWVEDLVGNEPFFTDNGDGTLTYTSPHGCTFTFNGTVP